MCGIFGISPHPEAARLAGLGLHALQHRGQESAGIVSFVGQHTHAHRGMGLVADVFGGGVLARLPGDAALGHVRYPTAGASHIQNAQPLLDDARALALAHNGNLTNAEALKEALGGPPYASSSDTEVILRLLATAEGATLGERLASVLPRVEGAFSLLLMGPGELVAARDPRGWRPLSLGRLEGAWVLASEGCAFDLIGAEFVRDLAPGEVLSIRGQEMVSRWLRPATPSLCLFEHVYLARPDSVIEGRLVYKARKEMGRRLAEEHPREVDVVVPVPDSGVSAALGYAERAGRPYELGLIRNHYIQRTFIAPQQATRDLGVRMKLNAQREILEGKRVAVIDDSLVRGTTAKKLVDLLRAAGAREVHLRIASPPFAWPCFYGIDTPTRAELIAAHLSTEEIRARLGADSLGYLSLEGLRQAVGGRGGCDACFTGRYPVPPPRPVS